MWFCCIGIFYYYVLNQGFMLMRCSASSIYILHFLGEQEVSFYLNVANIHG